MSMPYFAQVRVIKQPSHEKDRCGRENHGLGTAGERDLRVNGEISDVGDD